MLKSLIIAILSLIVPSMAFAQDGQVNIVQDSRVDELLERHKQMNELLMSNPDHSGIDGYRVQIFFESGNKSSEAAREIKEEFEENYPAVDAYLTWKAPNFRVRVGDFRTRMEAEGFLQRILKDYPNAWVIKDKINFPSLN
jgi:hypothetical protein